MNTNSPNSFEVQNTENQVEDNNSIEANVAEMRYLNQTPARKSTSKRPCTVLSPLSEDESDTKLLKLMSSAVERAISNAVLSLVAQVIVELQSAFSGVRKAVNGLKHEVNANVAQDLELSESKKRPDDKV